jgi:hypothetical protein
LTEIGRETEMLFQLGRGSNYRGVPHDRFHCNYKTAIPYLGMIVIDCNGTVAGGASTNGLTHKIPG